MKKLLLVGLMSLSLFACDNQNKEQSALPNEKQATNSSSDEKIIKEFRDAYLKSCLSSGKVTEQFCECVYSDITKKYSEIEMTTIYSENNKAEMDKLNADVVKSATKCVDAK